MTSAQLEELIRGHIQQESVVRALVLTMMTSLLGIVTALLLIVISTKEDIGRLKQSTDILIKMHNLAIVDEPCRKEAIRGNK
jgi:hypothetical protein